MSALWSFELRLFLRQRLALPALGLLLALASAAVMAGIAEIRHQQTVIARIAPQQASDVAAHAAHITDPGDAAYYTQHLTWDAPHPLAFAAIGQRDVAPYVLRVTALALEGQIYNGEYYNAEMALPGRFDWAFVLTYLAPLVLIALLHDLRSGEAEAGRMPLLRAMAAEEGALWRRRVLVRVGLVALALILPFAVGGVVMGVGAGQIFAVILLALAYLGFWAMLVFWLSRAGSSLAHAARLAGLWLVMVLVLPALALLAINAAIPVRQGVELTLGQREIVHAGWDRPKAQTMAEFARLYPRYAGQTGFEGGFHWKWYFAFQLLGDRAVADKTAAYRQGLQAREAWTQRLGWLLPSVGLQAVLHRMADSDLAGGFAYQDRIRVYHRQLREFYYPYLFEGKPFGPQDFAKAPRWSGHELRIDQSDAVLSLPNG